MSSEEQALVDAYNAVPDTDESYTPDAATMAAVLKSQDKTSAIADPLSVADQVASYGGVDLDAADAATTAANNAAAATALGNDDFSYTILPTGSGGITGSDTITRSGGANNSTDALLDLSADIAEGKIGTDEANATLNLITGNTLSASDVDALLPPAGEDLSFGSPLPGDNVVADLSGYAGYSQNDFLDAAGSDVQVAAEQAAGTAAGTTTDIPVIGKDLFEIGLTDYTPALIGSGLESGVSAALGYGVDLGLVGGRVVNPEFVTNAAGIDDRSGLDMLADELYVNRTGDTSIYDKFTVPVTLPVATEKTALENVLSNYSAGQYQEMSDNIAKLPQETKGCSVFRHS